VITVERDPDPVDMVLDSKDKRDDETKLKQIVGRTK